MRHPIIAAEVEGACCQLHSSLTSPRQAALLVVLPLHLSDADVGTSAPNPTAAAAAVAR